jgi:plastocyanin
MAKQTVQLKIDGKKVICTPSKLVVQRGDTITFEGLSHSGKFLGHLIGFDVAAAKAHPFTEAELRTVAIDPNKTPCHKDHWQDQEELVVVQEALSGAYSYQVTVQTPDGPITSDPIAVVEP